MLYSERFSVAPGSKIKRSAIDPSFKNKHESKESAEAENAEHARRLGELQYLLYAEDRRSLLVVLQAMDAGRKDGTVRHVSAAMTSQATRAHAFTVPAPEAAS